MTEEAVFFLFSWATPNRQRAFLYLHHSVANFFGHLQRRTSNAKYTKQIEYLRLSHLAQSSVKMLVALSFSEAVELIFQGPFFTVQHLPSPMAFAFLKSLYQQVLVLTFRPQTTNLSFDKTYFRLNPFFYDFLFEFFTVWQFNLP